MKKMFFTFLAFFIVTLANVALDNEFKNILLNIDFDKAGENTYKVNLLTQNPYVDEIKVVKKSDYYYYILLAETYAKPIAKKIDTDLNPIEIQLFPYVEQELNNGYTKIAFNTTKPTEFIISLKAKSASQFPVMDLVKVARLNQMYEQKQTTIKGGKVLLVKAEQAPQTVAQAALQTAAKTAESVQKSAQPASSTVQKTAEGQKAATTKSPQIAQGTATAVKPAEKAKPQKTAKSEAVKTQPQPEQEIQPETPVVEEVKIQEKIAQKIEELKEYVKPVKEYVKPAEIKKALKEGPLSIIILVCALIVMLLTRRQLAKIKKAKKLAQENALKAQKMQKQTQQGTERKPHGMIKPKEEIYEEILEENVYQTPKVALEPTQEVQQTPTMPPTQEVPKTMPVEQPQVSPAVEIAEESGKKELEIEAVVEQPIELEATPGIEIAAEKPIEVEKPMPVAEEIVGKVEEKPEERIEIVSERPEEKPEPAEEKIETMAEKTEIKEEKPAEELPKHEIEHQFGPQEGTLQEELFGEMFGQALLEEPIELLEEELPRMPIEELISGLPAEGDVAQPVTLSFAKEEPEEDGFVVLGEEEGIESQSRNGAYTSHVSSFDTESMREYERPALRATRPRRRIDSAKILSEVKIENDRGFYLADYRGVKALVGYIMDKVFVIHAFKDRDIKNTQIDFRLSETTKDGDYYFVRVNNSTLLVKSEKQEMSLAKSFS